MLTMGTVGDNTLKFKTDKSLKIFNPCPEDKRGNKETKDKTRKKKREN